MKVVSLDPQNEIKKKHKQDLINILNEMKKEVESGNIDEFVAASIGESGEIQIHAAVKDFIGGVGLFEIGKKIMIDSKEEE